MFLPMHTYFFICWSFLPCLLQLVRFVCLGKSWSSHYLAAVSKYSLPIEGIMIVQCNVCFQQVCKSLWRFIKRSLPLLILKLRKIQDKNCNRFVTVDPKHHKYSLHKSEYHHYAFDK